MTDGRQPALDHLAMHESCRMSGGGCPTCAARRANFEAEELDLADDEAQSRRARSGPRPLARPRSVQPRRSRLRRPAQRPSPRRSTLPTTARRGTDVTATLPPPLARSVGTPPPTRATVSHLPGWSGWSPPVTLEQLQQAAAFAAKSPRHRELIDRNPILGRFFQQGQIPIYRIADRRNVSRPISIGFAPGRSSSVAGRLSKHWLGQGGDPRVHRRLRTMHPAQIVVSMGTLARHLRSARLAHAYEILLQHGDAVQNWTFIQDTWTFESATRADDAVEAVLKDLRRA
jgi:hypothetical protein